MSGTVSLGDVCRAVDKAMRVVKPLPAQDAGHVQTGWSSHGALIRRLDEPLVGGGLSQVSIVISRLWSDGMDNDPIHITCFFDDAKLAAEVAAVLVARATARIEENRAARARAG